MSAFLDPNVVAVQERLRRRADAGFLKYGVTTAEADLDLEAWLRHMQEELLDGAVYIEAAIARLAGSVAVVDEGMADAARMAARLAPGALAYIPAKEPWWRRYAGAIARALVLTWIGGIAISVVWFLFLSTRP